METRANYMWVGGIALTLIAMVAGFALWLAHISREHRKLYDIYFHQSVEGLAKGSTVTYAGVPAGQISDIELSRDDPGIVRVRVAIAPTMPILQGTTATIQSSFTGVGAVQLGGGVKGAPPIAGKGPDGQPVIPTRRSNLGELLSNAPQLMEQLSALASRLTNVVSPENQRQLAGILANTNRLTATLADTAPQTRQVLSDLQVALQEATVTISDFQKVAANLNAQLDPNGPSTMHQLQDTLRSAQAAADALKATANDMSPAAQRVNRETLPQAEAAIRELRATARALRELTEKIDNQGAAAALGAPKLPEYHP